MLKLGIFCSCSPYLFNATKASPITFRKRLKSKNQFHEEVLANNSVEKNISPGR